jgi:phosphoglycolate phosphatase-like HAD superfamily hydrolase
MTLRIGFDMDGVLADLATAYTDVERRLFGDASEDAPGSPDPAAQVEDLGHQESTQAEDQGHQDMSAKEARRRLREERRRRTVVWHAIETTNGFWTTLAPLEPDVVRRIAGAAARHRWEVFFVTQRPETDGQTAQRQTQQWLAVHGFDLPSVIVTRGGRGTLARALHLDYLVDDTAQNCVDVVSDSKARALLVDRTGDPRTADNARKLGIAVVASAGEALDVLERAAAAHGNPTLFSRLAEKMGWKGGGG